MWNRKNYIEGLLAKSLYEPLTVREQRHMDKAIVNDDALAEVASRLKSMVEHLPNESGLDAPDLLPDLRAAIASSGSMPAVRRRMSPAVQLAGVAVAAIGVFGIWMGFFAWGPVENATIAQAPALSLMEQAIRQSEALIAEHNPGDAIHLLNTALRAQPADLDAPKARLMLADVLYEERLFGSAMDTYTAVQADHAEFVQAQDESVRIRIAERVDLLDECRADGFETLLAYHVALRESGDRFERLESVAARAAADPHGLLAERVLWSMAEAMHEPGALADADARVAALEQVRDRCEDAIVAARANFEAGRTYEVELGDKVRAAEAYRLAATHSTYEEAAATALARLMPR